MTTLVSTVESPTRPARAVPKAIPTARLVSVELRKMFNTRSGFWLMAKLVSNIASVGGEPNTMKVASYDWRLDFEALEKRDLYYSRLQTTIENLFRLTKQKVVIVAHSMGNLVFKYFLSWVQAHVSPHW